MSEKSLRKRERAIRKCILTHLEVAVEQGAAPAAYTWADLYARLVFEES